MLIRARDDEDLAACGDLVVAVNRLDGYPVKLPADPVSFLVVADPLGAWVAEDGGHVVGHVLLRPSTSEPVMAAASAAARLLVPRLAVVGRLLVAPAARRRGVGRALLEVATARAHELGRRPVLDVVAGHRDAVALYEDAGWRCVATVRTTFGEETYEELVFVGPEPAAPRARVAPNP